MWPNCPVVWARALGLDADAPNRGPAVSFEKTTLSCDSTEWITSVAPSRDETTMAIMMLMNFAERFALDLVLRALPRPSRDTFRWACLPLGGDSTPNSS